MTRDGEIDCGTALAAHLCGLLSGAATIVSLVPAMVRLVRILF